MDGGKFAIKILASKSGYTFEKCKLLYFSQKMKDEFLKADDFNVILVDWGGGSSFPYTQATANTRLVGAEIAKLISVLQVIGQN